MSVQQPVNGASSPGTRAVLPVATAEESVARTKSKPKTKAAELPKAGASASYPFSSIVGQDEMKLALILNVIDPRVGGVMIMGHRGTAKSTAVRALADILPSIVRVAGDVCNRTPDELDEPAPTVKTEKIPVPVVDLPLGATEDRICGTIDIEQALAHGKKRFEPGLLARAHRGFLYIDEVNLLEDHLVDLLLDVAASGRNVVEREGISVAHPARFVLVGSGNPEEGDLRPQLLDRFGLNVRITTVLDPALRVEIVKRRRSFDADPQAFAQAWEAQQHEWTTQIARARKRAGAVTMPDDVLLAIAQLCSDLGIDGHRGELTITRAACAHAAYHNHKHATLADVRAVALMALRHRLRRDPLETTDSDERIQRELEKI
jgi:magnesium chelatase subunit I